MTAQKARRCREIISKPGYWKDRAIQMGETYGATLAETFCHKNGKKKKEEQFILTEKYFKKMLWYARKVRAEQYDEIYDYET